MDIKLWFKGGPKILGEGAMNPNDAMCQGFKGVAGMPKDTTVRSKLVCF